MKPVEYFAGQDVFVRLDLERNTVTNLVGYYASLDGQMWYEVTGEDYVALARLNEVRRGYQASRVR